MPAAGFEPTIPASERPTTYTFDRVAPGTDMINSSVMDKTPTHALFTQHYISLAC